MKTDLKCAGINEPEKPIAAIFDLDRTVTRKDSFLPFLLIALKGRPYRVFHALYLPIAVLVFYLGFRDNNWLKRAFLRAIAGGASRSQVKMWSEKLLRGLLSDGINRQAVEELDYHRRCGHRTILVSASFDFYVCLLADILQFDSVVCTEAVWTDAGILRGTCFTENCYGMVKLRRIQKYFSQDRKSWHIVAYSDHHSDLPLLEWADKCIVVNPKRKFQKTAWRQNLEVQRWN